LPGEPKNEPAAEARRHPRRQVDRLKPATAPEIIRLFDVNWRDPAIAAGAGEGRMLRGYNALRLDVEQVVAGNVKLNQRLTLLTGFAEAGPLAPMRPAAIAF
jgi:hypothetical protein